MEPAVYHQGVSPSSVLSGKVILVTGGSRGIGKGIALELGRRGADIAINYVKNHEAAVTVVKELQAMGRDAIAVKADTSILSDIRTMFGEVMRHFGKLNVVVSNAGINSFSHLKDTEEAEFDSVFAVNTKGQYFVAQEAYRHCEEGGHIILCSSRTAQARGYPRHAVYAGSKGAIETFVRCMAVDCADKKITINAIAPGATMTDQYDDVVRKYVPNSEGMNDKELREAVDNWQILKRIGQPVDIGRVVAFLASEDGSWITGQVISADGGMLP
ncbi:hypothetical protein AnigIFM60653_009916 [Aspergillus niger]|nr:hypothetical protein AnigIFM50267_011794 [Aspergillus niger]GLA08385.1 hypothetical protein AnigIFM60653_009916 [Aspergillus niger]GLA19273.1 hypothetical protein AnigIFM62618_006942 [Aspergillus niger]